jgi:hypothetical protein
MQIKFLIAIFALMVQGCALVGGSVIPDETRVVDGPALSLPPDFELKPPSELSKKDNGYKAAEKARGVLLGSQLTNVRADDESWLINKAGQADSDIRAQLEAEEVAKEKTAKEGWLSKMWGSTEESVPEE